ncbi:MAG: hypothetical protein F9K32_09935 [Desulfobulbaceae bacterium]|nr:MAG: hypothetical protein F9K32_09935 [Desulfobulbaceae bacterium]
MNTAFQSSFSFLSGCRSGDLSRCTVLHRGRHFSDAIACPFIRKIADTRRLEHTICSGDVLAASAQCNTYVFDVERVPELGAAENRLKISNHPNPERKNGFEAFAEAGRNAHFFSCTGCHGENAVHRNVYSQDNDLVSGWRMSLSFKRIDVKSKCC